MQGDDALTPLWDHLAGVEVGELPGEVVRAAQSALLDHLLCVDLGLDQEPIRILARTLAEEWGPAGGAPPNGQQAGAAPQRLPARSRAFVHGAASHALELDDLYPLGMIHPGAVVVPAVLESARETGADGGDVLAGIVAGYELLGRLTRAVGTSHSYRGFHGTGVLGALAAAAGAARARRLPAGDLRSAVGVAASFGSGIKAFQSGPGMVKRLHPGRAAEGGFLAAALAANGFRGPSQAISGRFGVADVFVFEGEPALGELTDRLGEDFVVTDVYIKPLPACAAVHPAMFAVDLLRSEHGVGPEDLAAITVGGPGKLVDQNSNPAPSDVMTAQYSLEFCVALAWLGKGHDLRTYQDPASYTDPAVVRLIEMTGTAHDAEAEANYPGSKDARVTVRLRDGRELMAYGVANTATSSGWDVAERKARLLWGGRRDAASTDALVATVTGLAGAPGLDELLAAWPLRAAPATRHGEERLER